MNKFVSNALVLGAIAFSGFVLTNPASAQGLLASGDAYFGGEFAKWGGDFYYAPESGLGVVLGGRAMVPITDNISIQADGDFENTPGIMSMTSGMQGGVHLDYRQVGSFMVGAFGGLGTAVVDDAESYPGHILGVEGQIYLGDATVFAQLAKAYMSEDGGTSEEVNSVIARAGVRYFVDPTIEIHADATLASIEFEGSMGRIFTAGVGANWQPMQGQPLVLFTRLEGSQHYLDYCPATGTHARATAGIRMMLGADDLQTESLRGANTETPWFVNTAAIDGLEYC